MEVIPLQSGSSGNCVYVESHDVRLLFDAGISGRKAQERLADYGKDIRDVDALIISHDHRDHVCCLGAIHRKFGLPVYITKRTLETTQRRMKLGELTEVSHFDAGDTLCFGPVSVETFSTPHDAADGVVFVVDDTRCRFGLLTDLGHVFDGLREKVAALDAVLVESNYDPDMLAAGPYPQFLKTRISGPRGHLSNVDCANLLKSASARLQWACLAHLSDENNDPETAMRTHREILGYDFPLQCANRQSTTGMLRVKNDLGSTLTSHDFAVARSPGHELDTSSTKT